MFYFLFLETVHAFLVLPVLHHVRRVLGALACVLNATSAPLSHFIVSLHFFFVCLFFERGPTSCVRCLPAQKLRPPPPTARVLCLSAEHTGSRRCASDSPSLCSPPTTRTCLCVVCRSSLHAEVLAFDTRARRRAAHGLPAPSKPLHGGVHALAWRMSLSLSIRPLVALRVVLARALRVSDGGTFFSVNSRVCDVLGRFGERAWTSVCGCLPWLLSRLAVMRAPLEEMGVAVLREQ